MAGLSLLLSTILMGVSLIAVVLLLQSVRRRESPIPVLGIAGGGTSWVRGPAGWGIAFVALTLVAGLGLMVYVGAITISGATANAAGLVFAGVFAVLLGAYVVWGAYATARSHGFRRAGAMALGAWAFGVLVILSVLIKLITS